MLKTGKTPIHHLVLTEQSVLVAKSSSVDSTHRIEDFRTFEFSDENFEAAFTAYMGARKGNYARAYCSVLPVSRFVRRISLDSPNRAKDSAYLLELLSNTCKINTHENDIAVLLSTGAQLDADRPASKEIMFVGAKSDELEAVQSKLISWGVYPLRIELGTLPLVASIQKVAKAEGRKNSTLVLEVGESQSYIYIISESGLDMTRNISFGISAMLPHIKAELGLADEAVARKILIANTFDFTEMAPTLLRRLIKEIQASIGFYEVQTGYTIGQIFPANLSSRFQWVGEHLSRGLGLDMMMVSFDRWPGIIGVEVSESLDMSNADPIVWNLFALAGTYE